MTRIVDFLGRVQKLVENLAVVLASVALLLMGGIITASVLGRQLFLRPIPDDLLMVGLLMVPVIALPLAYIERYRGHISVTITTDWMGKRVLGLLRAFGALCMGVFFGGIAWMIVLRVPQDIARGTFHDGVFQIPAWPMKIVFGLGIAIFILRLCISVAQGLTTFVTGREIAGPVYRHGED